MEVFREILVMVAGLTPQVITETLYYLTQKRDPPVAITEIHVLTTQPGRQRILPDLLTPLMAASTPSALSTISIPRPLPLTLIISMCSPTQQVYR
jgi:CRISPR-associated protein (TIGR02584 family)